jgi:hypothetical protein
MNVLKKLRSAAMFAVFIMMLPMLFVLDVVTFGMALVAVTILSATHTALLVSIRRQ